MFLIAERILLTLWVGGMWAIGYIVAPTLFATLDDRALAGMLAGRMFTIMSYIGLVCGTGLLLSQLMYPLFAKIRQWRIWLIVAMLLITVIGEFILQPQMAVLKAAGIAEGSEAAKQFASLHGVASILFLANSLAGLVLVIFGLRPSRTDQV